MWGSWFVWLASRTVFGADREVHLSVALARIFSLGGYGILYAFSSLPYSCTMTHFSLFCSLRDACMVCIGVGGFFLVVGLIAHSIGYRAGVAEE